MERIIKFRAWIDSDKMMYDVLQFQAKFPKEDFYRVFINKERIEGQPMNYRITSKNALMQFTGLHDKNGKEIYEGDIIKTHYYATNNHTEYYTIGEIVYECPRFICADKVHGKNNNFDSSPFFTNQTEVIGNIYESPELLKPTNA